MKQYLPQSQDEVFQYFKKNLSSESSQNLKGRMMIMKGILEGMTFLYKNRSLNDNANKTL